MSEGKKMVISLVIFVVFFVVLVIVLNREKNKRDMADVDTNIIQGMVFVKGGTFDMGTSNGDKYDMPLHMVTLSDFYIGKYEITYKEYDRFCIAAGYRVPDDKDMGRGNKPVMDVNWRDATVFCNWKSAQEGFPAAYDTNTGGLLDSKGKITHDITKVLGCRLPTEAEWEFAARGGVKSKGYIYSGSDNPDEVAWYAENTYFKTSVVGKLKPNELGIYDMSGNLWEYCNDWYTPSAGTESVTNPAGPQTGKEHIVRGGCYKSRPDFALKLRKGNRYFYFLSRRGYITGFRIARSAP